VEKNFEREYHGYKDLKVFKLSYQLALEVFEATKLFPKEERYSLTDQIRRLARSVSANIVEAWYRRKYPNSFVSKLTDSAAEAGETGLWIDFAGDHGYLPKDKQNYLLEKYEEVNKMLNSMIIHPEKFCH